LHQESLSLRVTRANYVTSVSLCVKARLLHTPREGSTQGYSVSFTRTNQWCCNQQTLRHNYSCLGHQTATSP